LKRIWQYVSRYGDHRADTLVNDLVARFQEIADQPLLLGAVDEEFGSDYRSSPAGDYIVFYTVIIGGIEIMRVIHGSRDIGGAAPF
jgi:toxin ParE1/3/4